MVIFQNYDYRTRLLLRLTSRRIYRKFSKRASLSSRNAPKWGRESTYYSPAKLSSNDALDGRYGHG